MIPANIPINPIPKLKSFRRRVYIYIYRGSGLSPFAFLINLRNIKRLKLNCVCETKDGGVRICLSPEAHYSIISTNWISSFWITLSKSYLLPSREFQSRRKKRSVPMASPFPDYLLSFVVSFAPSAFLRRSDAAAF